MTTENINTQAETEESQEYRDRVDDYELENGDPQSKAAALRRVTTAALRDELRRENERQTVSVVAAQTKYKWFRAHPSFAVDANEFILDSYLKANHIQISLDAYDIAALACRSQLVERQPERQPEPELTPAQIVAANNARLLAMTKKDLWREVKQGRAIPEPAVNVPYSAKELKQMDKRVLKNLVSYDNGQDRQNGAIRREVNRILAADAEAQAAARGQR